MRSKLYIFTFIILHIGAVAVLGAPWSPKVDVATTNDVRFVFNSGHIPANQNYKVLHSFTSGLSFGDHIEAYAIQLESFPNDLVKQNEKPKWAVGPCTNSVFSQALKEAALEAEGDKLSWFPAGDELNSSGFYLHFEQLVLSDDDVYAGRIFAYERQRKILYYISFKR